jgi:hypothetical protein
LNPDSLRANSIPEECLEARIRSQADQEHAAARLRRALVACPDSEARAPLGLSKCSS